MDKLQSPTEHARLQRTLALLRLVRDRKPFGGAARALAPLAAVGLVRIHGRQVGITIPGLAFLRMHEVGTGSCPTDRPWQPGE